MPPYTDWGSNVQWSPTTAGGGWGGAGRGALSGAATGAAIGSILPGPGTIIGAGLGALIGGISGGKKKKLSNEEQWANNYGALGNAALRQYGVPSIEGQYQGIQGYADAIKNFQAQGAPNLSALGGTIGDARRVAGKLENFQPERLDRALGEERDYLANVNTNINPLAMRQRAQADAAGRLRAGNPSLTEYQRNTLNRQDRTAAEQGIAEQGVGMMEGARGRIAGMSGQADSLVANALQAAMQGQLGIGQLQTIMAQLPMEYQGMLLSALGRIPGMYQDFRQSFAPGQNQYAAAAQGGRTSNLLSDIGSLASAYGQWRSGRPAPAGTSSNRQPNMPGESKWE